MASELAEIDVLPDGMVPDFHGKGPFVLNMERFADAWRVRRGFGQRLQHDTTLAMNYQGSPVFLGATIFTTDFGHEQVLTIHSATVQTGSLYLGSEANQVGMWVPTYFATVYDLTTDEVYEVPLHRQTADQEAPNERRHAHYETDHDRDTTSPLRAPDTGVGQPEPFFFQQFNDLVFFGSKSAGLWAYRPAVFSGRPKTQQLDGHDDRPWHYQAYGEDPCIVSVAPAPGLFAGAYAYLGKGELPKPQAVAVLGGRFVYAAGKTLYFSDVAYPTSVVADNTLLLPAEEDIVALAELREALVVFTANETFTYLPSQGALASGGRVIKVSDHVGCASVNGVLRTEGALFWLDRRGVFTTADGLKLDPLTEGWEGFFSRDGVSNPWTQFYQDFGYSSLANPQPRIQLRYEPALAHLCYDQIRRQLYVTFPAQDFSLVLREGKWSLWTYESVAAAPNAVTTTANITTPWLLMGKENLFAAGSFDQEALTDEMRPAGGTVSGETATVSSVYILEYERGGGVDRTSHPAEDRRRFAGKWYLRNDVDGMNARDGRNAFYLCPPLPLGTGFTFPNRGVVGNDCWLVPVEVVPDENSVPNPDQIVLRVRFDNTKWRPVTYAAGNANVDALLPSERRPSQVGWRLGAGAAGGQVRVFDSATGLAGDTGNELRIEWDGSLSSHHGNPNMRLVTNQRNRLIYIPMAYIGASTSVLFGMGFTGVTAQETLTATYINDAALYAWQEAYATAIRHTENEVDQPVDWAVKSDQVGLEGANQLKARTLYLKVKAAGVAASPIATTRHGQLNALYASDFKDWAAQVIDHDPDRDPATADQGDLRLVAKGNTIRIRFKNVAGALTRLVYGASGTEWGQTADESKGTVLIGDRPLDTIAISEMVKGEHVSVMVFGHIRHPAESLEISQARLTVAPIAGRRRRGR